jgi:hypothetical protein
VAEESFSGTGEGVELALSGDTIRKRHIATRASNRRRITVLVVGDADFEGYSIGLDEHSLQMLEVPRSGRSDDPWETSTIALEYIVAITDSVPFNELTPEEKNIVDRRTASFRKSSHNWLVENWPNVYDRRDNSEDSSYQNRQRSGLRRSGGRPTMALRKYGTEPARTEVRDEDNDPETLNAARQAATAQETDDKSREPRQYNYDQTGTQ